MDMSSLSDSDLQQIAKGDFRMVSEKGLRLLASHAPRKDPFKEVAQESSGYENFMAGMGGAMKGMYLGGKQMLGMADQAEIDQHKAAMEGLKSTTSGTLGDIAGTILPTAPLMGVGALNTLRGAAAVGAGMGALNPTSGEESRLENVALGALGGLGGQYLGSKLGGLIAGRKNMPSASSGSSATASTTGGSAGSSTNVTLNPTMSASGGGAGFGYVGQDASAGLNAAQANMLKIGQQLGFRTTPGQASGSKALQQFEAKLESQPMTSGPFNEIRASNQETLNKIAAKAIGEESNTLDATVLEQAKDRIGSVYKMIADKKARPIDPDAFLNRLSSIEAEYEGLANITQNPLVNKFISYATKGEATGEQLQDLASKLGKAANGQMTSATGDRQLGMALSDVKNHVDDLLESSLSGETKKAFQKARSEYRNLMLLTQRVGVVNPSSGNVQGVSLANLLQTKDKNGFLFGKNNSDLYNAARFAQANKPIVGDSGTATRSMVANPINFALSLPMSIASRAYASSPSVNLAVRAGAVADNGVMPNAAGRWLGPRLGYSGLVTGGLLGQAQ